MTAAQTGHMMQISVISLPRADSSSSSSDRQPDVNTKQLQGEALDKYSMCR